MRNSSYLTFYVLEQSKPVARKSTGISTMALRKPDAKHPPAPKKAQAPMHLLAEYEGKMTVTCLYRL